MKKPAKKMEAGKADMKKDSKMMLAKKMASAKKSKGKPMK